MKKHIFAQVISMPDQVLASFEDLEFYPLAELNAIEVRTLVNALNAIGKPMLARAVVENWLRLKGMDEAA